MRAPRARRSCHAVPGTSERFLAKAPTLGADEVFLDLEDAAAADQKDAARAQVIEALRSIDFAGVSVSVRVNATDTPYYYRDLIDVVEQAGAYLDTVMVPKVRSAAEVAMTDMLLSQIELAVGLEPGRIGIEAQIEDARGLIACEEIASASPRMEALIFGPGAAGIQAIDGPYARFDDTAGLVAGAGIARALGLDGKWTIHPSQIAVVNEIFTPAQSDFERASAMLAAFEDARAGALRFEGEMIDEANRKMAERIVRAGLAAGLSA
jgi:citrate lyase subunit beta/citryl-CoA lyase